MILSDLEWPFHSSASPAVYTVDELLVLNSCEGHYDYFLVRLNRGWIRLVGSKC